LFYTILFLYKILILILLVNAFYYEYENCFNAELV